MEEQEILSEIENHKEAIKVLKQNNNDLSSLKNVYSAIICLEWDLHNLRLNNISKVVKEALDENLTDFPTGRYQYKITLSKDLSGNISLEATVDNSNNPSEWAMKKDFALEKFNQIGIPFEKIDEGKFDIWRLIVMTTMCIIQIKMIGTVYL